MKGRVSPSPYTANTERARQFNVSITEGLAIRRLMGHALILMTVKLVDFKTKGVILRLHVTWKFRLSIMKPPNNDMLGTQPFVLCREVVLFRRLFCMECV